MLVYIPEIRRINTLVNQSVWHHQHLCLNFKFSLGIFDVFLFQVSFLRSDEIWVGVRIFIRLYRHELGTGGVRTSRELSWNCEATTFGCYPLCFVLIPMLIWSYHLEVIKCSSFEILLIDKLVLHSILFGDVFELEAFVV